MKCSNCLLQSNCKRWKDKKNEPWYKKILCKDYIPIKKIPPWFKDL